MSFEAGGSAAVLGICGAQETFVPEKIWSYELGAKTDWLDRRLRLNLSAAIGHHRQFGNFNAAHRKGATRFVAELQPAYRR